MNENLTSMYLLSDNGFNTCMVLIINDLNKAQI